MSAWGSKLRIIIIIKNIKVKAFLLELYTDKKLYKNDKDGCNGS